MQTKKPPAAPKPIDLSAMSLAVFGLDPFAKAQEKLDRQAKVDADRQRMLRNLSIAISGDVMMAEVVGAATQGRSIEQLKELFTAVVTRKARWDSNDCVFYFKSELGLEV